MNLQLGSEEWLTRHHLWINGNHILCDSLLSNPKNFTNYITFLKIYSLAGQSWWIQLKCHCYKLLHLKWTVLSCSMVIIIIHRQITDKLFGPKICPKQILIHFLNDITKKWSKDFSLFTLNTICKNGCANYLGKSILQCQTSSLLCHLFSGQMRIKVAILLSWLMLS